METPDKNQHNDMGDPFAAPFGSVIKPSNHDDIVALGYGETDGYAAQFEIGDPVAKLPEYKPETLAHSIKRQVPPMVKIAIAIAFLVFASLAGTVYFAFVSPSVEHPAVQEYVPGAEGMIGEVDAASFLQKSPDFAIGATAEGVAVFLDPEKAFETFKTNYAPVIEAIRAGNGLIPLSAASAPLYKRSAMQTVFETKELREQAVFVGQFLDIYENSF